MTDGRGEIDVIEQSGRIRKVQKEDKDEKFRLAFQVHDVREDDTRLVCDDLLGNVASEGESWDKLQILSKKGGRKGKLEKKVAKKRYRKRNLTRYRNRREGKGSDEDGDTFDPFHLQALLVFQLQFSLFFVSSLLIIPTLA